jgi:hypothetical protein
MKPKKVSFEIEDSMLENDNDSFSNENSFPDEVYERTQADIDAFVKCFRFHACLFEGPIGFIEGLIRGFLFITTSAFLLVIAILTCQKQILHISYLYIREGLLSWAISLTLLIPCFVLIAYQNFDPEVDWNMEPLPTVIGYADVRRFIIFSFGQGDLAANIEYNDISSSHDSWKGGFLCQSPRILLKKYNDVALQRHLSQNM